MAKCKQPDPSDLADDATAAPRRSARSRRPNLQLQSVGDKVTYQPRPPKSTVDIPEGMEQPLPNPLAPAPAKKSKKSKKKTKVCIIIFYLQKISDKPLRLDHYSC